jgi:hypothetical protein
MQYPQMNDRLEFKYSPQKQLGLLIISGVIVALCAFVAMTTTDIVHRVLAWIGVPLFMLCGLVALKRMTGGGTPFVFDSTGIVFPGGNFGILPWAEIKSYSLVTLRGNEFLALTFNDPERVLARVSPTKRKMALANAKLGLGHWSLTFIALTPGIQEAMTFIRQRKLVGADNVTAAAPAIADS